MYILTSNTAIVSGDYDSEGVTAYSTAIALDNWNTSGYNNYLLNYNGLSAINTTGITKFGLRLVKDAENTNPGSPGYDKANVVYAYYADQSGTTYDPRLVIEDIVPEPGPGTIQNLSFDYDPNNNITQIIDFSDTITEKVSSYSYDNNGNLTNVASNSVNIATLSWSYDNRLTKYKSSTASVSYAYDYTGQRIKVKTIS